ncbi:HEAT repeat domain-containing protein [Streptomyces fructofermentans]|uniref:HEAT repeat domain-containing protein n=1 Tax=Streptomyces fructofermentans TaxID=152141 RepID=UPI00378EBF72
MAGHEVATDALKVIEETDWSGLTHAYGAAGDTPAFLLQLLDEDPETQAEALGMLEMSVLHQGSLYDATAPAARFMAAVLSHPRTLAEHESYFPWDDRPRPLRAALIDFLAEVAESAAYDDDPDSGAAAADTDSDADPDADEAYDDEADAIEACLAVRPTLFQAVVPFLDDDHPEVREAALGAVSHLLKAPELAEAVPAASRRLHSTLADTTRERRERAAAALTLGTWGQDTTAHLTDADPAVRVCAALADGAAGDPRATAVLLDALSRPAEADRWFPEPLPQFDGWFRFTLLRTLLKRVESYEEAAPAALALIPLASDYTVDQDWGPLLAKAFPGGREPGSDLTPAQRDLLHALAENDACWGNIGNKYSWLRDAGLPQKREELRSLL